MTTNLNEGSAKIYQFPAGGRAGFGARRLTETRTSVEPVASHRVDAACSGSWYHEAAIQESWTVR
jgi:hypothetical protein